MSIAAPAVDRTANFQPPAGFESPSSFEPAAGLEPPSSFERPAGFVPPSSFERPAGCRARRLSPAEARTATNATLVAAALDGEEWAWDALVRRYRGLVGTIARAYRVGRASADDVEQLVWMRLYENLGRIRRPEALGGWIASVTRNACLRLKQRQDREVPSDEELTRDLTTEESIEAELLATERSVALRQALGSLPRRRRQLLEALLDQPDLTHEELGRRIGMPTGSIGPTRFRSIEALRSVPALAALTD